MPGLLLQDSGFPLENGTTFPISNAFCLQNSAFCSVLQQDQNGITGSLPLPSDSSLTSSGLTRCLDASSCISRTLPFKHRCSSTLMRAATAHALSTRSWSPPSIDVNNGDDEVAALQDYETLWSDIVDNGTDVPNISGCNTGIMLGSFFCDLKDVAKRTSFSTEGSPSGSPTSPTVASLSKYFTSSSNEDCLTADYVYASDEFRMFEFKVRRCTRGRSHDWTECPFAHPGEKARRRDPRRFHYSGTSCPDFRKGNCKRGDACEFAHGVFECWLHPARYRTQPCKDGRSCTRRVCFFAHTPEQLRLLPAAAHSPSTSALRINGSCDLHPYSEIYQSASLSGNCFNEDSFDESMAYGVLECSGSFDGSRCLHAGSPRARHSRCTASHTASPTSTLVCIPHSPSVSPPLSPSSPHSWHGPLSPALPIAATARGFPPHSSLLSSSRTNFPRVQALLASAQSDGSSFTPGIQFSAPSLSLPSFAHANLYKSLSSAPASPSGIPPSPSRKSVNDLVMAVQQLDLKGMNQMWLQHSSSPHASAPSPLSRSSNTFSSSENDVWCADVIEEDEYKLQRVESGKALRAEIYGRAIEAETIMDQDESLGWVNDLV